MLIPHRDVMALRAPVCTVAAVRIQDVGVDAVDPRVLERALRVEGDQLPYVTRGEVDERLRTHLARAREGTGPALVCLYGPSKAGKTRSMIHALKAELPHAAIVAPNRTREDLQTILDAGLLRQAADDHNGWAVLWLDDLEGFVRVGNSGLDSSSLATLKRQLPGLVVPATAGGRGRATRTGHPASDLFEPLSELLERGVTEDLDAELATRAERNALAAVAPPDLAKAMHGGLGAVAVSGRRLVRILRDKSHPHFEDGRICAEGAAVTWAAITAYRLGVTEPIPDDLLRTLFACHGISEEAFERALRWATEPLYGSVALLRSRGGAYAPYDYLVQHAPGVEPDAERCVWRELLQRASAADVFELGVRAYERARLDDALDAFRRADELGDATSAFNLGFLLHERGDVQGAQEAYHRADERGDASGALNLGLVLQERGDLEGAQEAYHRADERGEAKGAFNLGFLLHERGDVEGAEEAYRRADERGDVVGTVSLGGLLEERGDLEGAEEAYRRADERGLAHSAVSLGLVLQKRGDLEGAEEAYRRADERGHARGAVFLGLVLEERGDLEGAEAAYLRADDLGDAGGASNLGRLLKERGDLEGAEAAYRRADDRGDAGGAFNLGRLLKERGDLEGAEEAYRRADERGDAAGAFNIGEVLQHRGDLEGAEMAYRRADERGDAFGAVSLGLVLEERGDVEGAEAAYRRADERGDAFGAVSLGLVLEERRRRGGRGGGLPPRGRAR